MTEKEYIDYIKLTLGGDILDLELPDSSIQKFVNQAFKEVQRYIDTTRLIKVPYASCLDLTNFKCSAIIKIYRTEGYTGDSTSGIGSGVADPMYAQQWMVFSNGGTMYNVNDYIMNYVSYNTLLQIRNTTSTDLSFKFDKQTNRLYINTGYNKPNYVVIEYIPIFENIEEITDEYWIDILRRLSLALVKIALGRIRTRFKVSGNLYSDDGDTILQEGNSELTELRTSLAQHDNLFTAID